MVIAAYSQSRGRGRRGRPWLSGAGQGAWVSVVQPLHDRREAGRLPILLPVALCQALRAMGIRECGLRWPNDVVVDGRKLGGVLIEVVAAEESAATAIAGFGVNLLPPEPAAVPRPAVGVIELLEIAPTTGRFTRLLADAVVAALSRTPQSLVDTYSRLSVHEPGERLSCRLGAETVEGTFAGFDVNGFLKLSGENGLRIVSAGELVER